MKEKFAKLIELKSIVTLLLIGCTVYLAIVNKIEIQPETFIAIVMAVITYYFTRKADK